MEPEDLDRFRALRTLYAVFRIPGDDKGHSRFDGMLFVPASDRPFALKDIETLDKIMDSRFPVLMAAVSAHTGLAALFIAQQLVAVMSGAVEGLHIFYADKVFHVQCLSISAETSAQEGR